MLTNLPTTAYEDFNHCARMAGTCHWPRALARLPGTTTRTRSNHTSTSYIDKGTEFTHKYPLFGSLELFIQYSRAPGVHLPLDSPHNHSPAEPPQLMGHWEGITTICVHADLGGGALNSASSVPLYFLPTPFAIR